MRNLSIITFVISFQNIKYIPTKYSSSRILSYSIFVYTSNLFVSGYDIPRFIQSIFYVEIKIKRNDIRKKKKKRNCINRGINILV